MNILFRADASSQIGVGHITRCLTLAAVLRERGAAVSFACRALPGFDPAMVQAQGFALIEVPEEADDLAALAGRGFDWVVVDHYGLDRTWERAARAVARRIAVIDDLANRTHHADLLLDQNLTASEAAYEPLLNAECERVLGPRYALLRPEFSAPTEPRPVQARHVLVSFGGFDVAGMALKALEALAPFPELQVTLLAGHGHPQRDQLQAYALQHPHWQVLDYSPNMADLMRDSDLFIGAGGGTTWERAALGVPSLCVAVADNQVKNAEALAREGAHVYLGEASSVSVSALSAAIALLIANAPLRHSLAERARRLVDGRGAQRVATCLLGPLLHLRPATEADAQLLFDGRNADAVRQASYDTRPLEWPLHLAWLYGTLADPARALFIGEAGGQPIGMLRYDRHPTEPGRAEVSLYLFEAYLGQGWGRWLIHAGEAWLLRHWPDVVRVDAAVLPHNSASLHLFHLAGFTQQVCEFTRALEHRHDQDRP
ncbi:UDP-2,4-diacetamido-2,4,6-trideoxy-beta-L-altropyranose hydrolase [Pseudomonas japonica]|uniref:UDP-2,4-diacetamido-2,4, 6-trideoxy-beta-L-altropyranose hydrolase n=1 Tax=Pseudomonas japonica TaxID=256466 RepID=UPI0015E2A655|nr:UDP-2,4-diacetamido-2,4,6-trideoxy-beta-L-altropyranose hydrolase [Pseudomonas japonica]MBA1242125.1 UDP-2,4-diacetamido-2,4,6-trideoxy-beta-L-altropyranose hydrolase [Pseudomonas japonica]MBA1291558.1 UDP-2,4-diacetamido-2,4,6-trideoxy-beta-L-altropyranose hydrolase [Pseudomonas japonica]